MPRLLPHLGRRATTMQGHEMHVPGSKLKEMVTMEPTREAAPATSATETPERAPVVDIAHKIHPNLDALLEEFERAGSTLSANKRNTIDGSTPSLSLAEAETGLSPPSRVHNRKRAASFQHPKEPESATFRSGAPWALDESLTVNATVEGSEQITARTPEQDDNGTSTSFRTRTTTNASSATSKRAAPSVPVTPSAHTFGSPTPPSSDFTFSRSSVSSASAKAIGPENVPPLPALNHRALRASFETDVNPLVARLTPSTSMPALTTKQRPSNHRRAYHRRRESIETRSQSRPRRPGSRTRRSSSVDTNDTRRSSAEYSSRQASIHTVDTRHEREAPWQARVSVEMVRLSLLRQTTASSAPQLEDRVDQQTIARPTGSAVRDSGVRGVDTLGSPFLLSQDTAVKTGITLDTLSVNSLSAPHTLMTSTPSFSSVNGKGKAKAVAEDGNPRAQIARYPASERTTRTISTGSGKGKRKASEVESSGHTPPEKKGRATFAADNRPHRSSATSTSASSRAPSSYYHREPKRVRLSPMATPDNAQRATRSSKLPSSLPGDPFGRTAAVGSRRSPIPSPTAYRPPLRSTSIQQQAGGVRRPPSVSRNSLSQVSIPISALITPHAPDASILSRGTYHMRDPTRPPAIKPTPWSLRLMSDAGDPGSPVQAWLFFVGFIIFPVWWIAGFLRIPKTRTLHVSPDPSQPARPGGPVVLDNPQVEHDARSWRLRCRVMSGVSLLTYVPFIVCVAVFVPR